VDKTKFHKINEIAVDSEYVQLKGNLRRLEMHGSGRKKRLVGTFRDDTGVMELVWFKGVNWIYDGFQTGMEYIVYGKPTAFDRKFSIVHPDIEPVTEKNNQTAALLEPVYPTTEKLRTKRLDAKGIWKIMRNLFEKVHPHRAGFPENLPEYLRSKMRLMERYETFLALHFPKTQDQVKAARNRIKFEELFFLQLRILQTKTQRKIGFRGAVFSKIGDNFNTFFHEGLKFELTGAQKRVLKEIRKDVGSGLQMNRLVQGDVGSGKTIVGFMAMLMGLDNDYQTALMAPTEILAQQHFQSLSEMAEILDLRIELLTGTIKGKARKLLLADLEAGKIDILVGTHALIEEKVKFENLGLVI